MAIGVFCLSYVLHCVSLFLWCGRHDPKTPLATMEVLCRTELVARPVKCFAENRFLEQD